MPAPDLRAYLAVLEKHRELRSETDPVDLRFELSEFLGQTDNTLGPALRFEQVNGHSMQVVGNLVGTPQRLALAFGLKNESKLLETYRKRRGRSC